MSKAIGVDIGGEIDWHAPYDGPDDLTTMCGLDSEDPAIGHYGTIDPTPGQKITCTSCKAVWEGFKRLKLRESDFAK